jgi:hypothetical protein
VSLGGGRLEAAEVCSLRTKTGVTLRNQKRSEDTGGKLQSNNITD